MGWLQVYHVAYSADSMALFGDIYLRDDEQLNWKPGMLEFNYHLTEVRRRGLLLHSYTATCLLVLQGRGVPVVLHAMHLAAAGA